MRDPNPVTRPRVHGMMTRSRSGVIASDPALLTVSQHVSFIEQLSGSESSENPEVTLFGLWAGVAWEFACEGRGSEGE